MILVTGASGFVGSALCHEMHRRGLLLRAAVRTLAPSNTLPDVPKVAVGDLSGATNWRSALQGVTGIIHCAGRAHVMQEQAQDPLTAYRQVNRDATEALARQAAEAGVKRLVFISSVKVDAEETVAPLSLPSDHPPTDSYALSKWEAEQALFAVARDTGLEVVVVRPPLVYGPGVGANFLRLMRWVQRGVPLPLGRVRNLRSLVGLDNLVDFLLCCAEHERAAGQRFFVSDGQDVSTPELIRAMALSLNRSARLLPVPVPLLGALARLGGREAELSRLTGSLQVDISAAKALLNWEPVVTLDQELKRTANWLREQPQ